MMLTTGYFKSSGSITTTPTGNTDDVYTLNTTESTVDNNDLIFGHLSSNGRDNGIRFINNALVKDVTIRSAFVRYTANQTLSGTPVNMTLSGQNTDEPAAFSDWTDWTSRSDTTATVAWNTVESFTDGVQYDTPDISTIVSEITSLSGWTSGDDMVIFNRNNGTTGTRWRRTSGYNFSSGAEAPELHVDWEII